MRWLIRTCLRIDTWLHGRFGRPYDLVLAVGLIIEIVRRMSELRHHAESATHIFGVIMVVMFEIALLIHQIGALGHVFGRHRETEAEEA